MVLISGNGSPSWLLPKTISSGAFSCDGHWQDAFGIQNDLGLYSSVPIAFPGTCLPGLPWRTSSPLSKSTMLPCSQPLEMLICNLLERLLIIAQNQTIQWSRTLLCNQDLYVAIPVPSFPSCISLSQFLFCLFCFVFIFNFCFYF